MVQFDELYNWCVLVDIVSNLALRKQEMAYETGTTAMCASLNAMLLKVSDPLATVKYLFSHFLVPFTNYTSYIETSYMVVSHSMKL